MKERRLPGLVDGRPARARAFVLRFVLALVVSACAESGESRGGAPSTTSPSSPPTPHAATGSPPWGGPPASRVADLDVHVQDDDGLPVVGRVVVARDHRGARRDGMTDEEGGVILEALDPPYDLRVEGSPSDGGRAVPTVLLGLGRAEAAIRLDEHDSSALPPPERIRLGVVGPPGVEGELLVTTSSASGVGAASSGALHPGEVTVLEVDHTFVRAWLAPGERVRVHVLVRPSGGGETALGHVGSFGYGVFDAGAADPGARADLGIVTVAAADATVHDVVVDGAAMSSGWSIGAQAALRFVDGAEIPLGAISAGALRVRVPSLPGASWCIAAAAERLTSAPGDLHAGSQVRACTAVGAALAPADLVLASVPALLAPQPAEGLSRLGHGLRFVPREGPTVFDARLVLEGGAVLVRVLTEAPDVPFARLVALGIPRLARGPAVLDLRTEEGRGLDDLADPSQLPVGATIARRTLRTSRRVRFVVTP
jgi:hypothetical protein